MSRHLKWKITIRRLDKIEDLKNIELNALSVYDDWHIKTKIRAYKSLY